jgi:two-component system cell cycle sensor histidine kinase/response regulator CckA
MKEMNGWNGRERELKTMDETDSTILVVDDEREIVEMTTTILNRAGFTAVGTTDPEEALRLVKTNRAIKVLLTDVMMPKTTGPELVRRAQRIRRGKLRVLFMSGGFDDVRFRQTDRVLGKPWSSEELLNGIRGILSETPPSVEWNGPERRKHRSAA